MGNGEGYYLCFLWFLLFLSYGYNDNVHSIDNIVDIDNIGCIDNIYNRAYW